MPHRCYPVIFYTPLLAESLEFMALKWQSIGRFQQMWYSVCGKYPLQGESSLSHQGAGDNPHCRVLWPLISHHKHQFSCRELPTEIHCYAVLGLFRGGCNLQLASFCCMMVAWHGMHPLPLLSILLSMSGNHILLLKHCLLFTMLKCTSWQMLRTCSQRSSVITICCPLSTTPSA